MITNFIKYLSTVFALLLFAMLTATYFYPQSILLFGITFLLGFITLNFAVLENYKETRLQNRIPHAFLKRNLSIDFASVLFTLILASILGWHIVGFVTHYIGHNTTGLIIGIIIGLIIGTITGILVRRMTNYLIRKPPRNSF